MPLKAVYHIEVTSAFFSFHNQSVSYDRVQLTTGSGLRAECSCMCNSSNLKCMQSSNWNLLSMLPQISPNLSFRLALPV